MRELVVSSSSTEELSVEERNLLSVAYKNVIGSRRAAWRTLNAGVDEGKFDDLLLAYRKQVESELSDVCLDVLNLLEDTLVKTNTKVSTDENTTQNENIRTKRMPPSPCVRGSHSRKPSRQRPRWSIYPTLTFLFFLFFSLFSSLFVCRRTRPVCST
jgi:hypothetical protein